MRKESVTMLNAVIGRSLLLIALALPGSTVAFGQVEISGFGGLSTRSGQQGIRGVFGAAGGAYVGKYVYLFGEYSRIPLESYYYLTSLQGAIHYTRHYDNFAGGLHIRFLPDRKVQPYILFPAIGAARLTVNASAAGFDYGRTDVYLGVGAGVRLLATEKWGFRAEYRRVGFVNTKDFWGSDLTVNLVTGGVFVQF